MDKTKIQWTQGDDGSPGATWNPFRGCRRISPGCVNCYAEAIAARFSKPGRPFHGFATLTPSGPRWTGKVDLIQSKLEEPLRWKKPRRIFVCSMSDLFYEEASADMIQAVVDIMYRARQHTYIVLTKRAKRMSEILRHMRTPTGVKWGDRPPEHVWVGVSVENQEMAEERIPFLLKTPAVVRFLSVEPLLGPVNLGKWLKEKALGLSWIIVGGESGDNARPMEIEWARSVVRQCKENAVPVFVKQLGRLPLIKAANGTGPDLLRRQLDIDGEWPEGTRFGNPTGKSELNGVVAVLRDPKGGDPAEWPNDLYVRQFPRSPAVGTPT